MTKKILLLGSSIVCSLGICLVALVLTSAAVEKVYANGDVETGTSCSDLTCLKGGGLCASGTCDSSECKCPNAPDDQNKCPCGKK
jgi:hypothetical protein